MKILAKKLDLIPIRMGFIDQNQIFLNNNEEKNLDFQYYDDSEKIQNLSNFYDIITKKLIEKKGFFRQCVR